MKDYVILAFKNVKKRGLRSWLTMLGIFIGIASVVSLISLGNGLNMAITGQFSTLDPNKLVVLNAETGFGPPGSTAVQKLKEYDQKLIEKVGGVDLVIPRYIRVAKVEYNEIVQFSYISNVPEDDKKMEVVYDALNVNVENGRLLNKNDRKKVVLGNSFTNDDFGKPVRIGSKLKIQEEEFEVVGILKQGSSFQINYVILMMDDDLKDILKIDDEIDMLVVQVKDGFDVIKVSEGVSDKLRDDRNLKPGQEDFSVQSPSQSLEAINTILAIINIVVGGIAAISLLVGGIGIANTMYTSVLERTKEIGVMKAVGARNRDILTVFITESAILGLVGGIIGAIMGLGLAFLVAFGVQSAFSGLNFSVDISWPLIILAISFSLVIGMISGIFPALQASKLKPVDALRS